MKRNQELLWANFKKRSKEKLSVQQHTVPVDEPKVSLYTSHKFLWRNNLYYRSLTKVGLSRDEFKIWKKFPGFIASTSGL